MPEQEKTINDTAKSTNANPVILSDGLAVARLFTEER
jgi:hypothetical protein